MRRKIYRTLAVVTVVSGLVMALFTWYVVGIVGKYNTMEVLESRVDYISEMLYKKEIRRDSFSYQISDEYKSRARALAIMLSNNTDILNDELQLEELQTAIGADAISLYDENLQLEHTTGTFSGDEKYLKDFEPAITNKLFSSAKLDISRDYPKIVVGCSRIDKAGIIQVEYISENVDRILNLLDISDMFIGVPIMKTGCLALIDNETMNYIAHTNEEMIGKPSHFNLKEDFFGPESFLDCQINGEDVLVCFDICNNETVIGYIPYSEIYNTRNDTIIWVVAAALIISCVVTLTIRSKVLHLRKKEKKKK